MSTLDDEPNALKRGFKRLWSLIHGYDDIRGSRTESRYPLDPTAEELAKAKEIRERNAQADGKPE